MQAVFTAIGQFFTDLLAKVTAVLQWILQVITAVFTDLVELGRDLFCWCVDQALGVAVTAIGALDFTPLQGLSGLWGGLGGEIINMLGLLGVGTCLAIISAAALIRLGLQLIPFTRLGS